MDLDFSVKYFTVNGKDFELNETNSELLKQIHGKLYDKVAAVHEKLGDRKPTFEEENKLRKLEITYGLVELLMADWYETVEADIFSD